MSLPSLPNVVFSAAPKAARAAINRSAPQITTQTIAAADSVIPWIGGRAFVNGLLGPVGVSSGNLVVCYYFCWGEVDAIEQVYIHDEPAPAAYLHKYTGTTTQGVDAWLAAAAPGYDDANVLTIGGETRGVCYCVISVPPGKYQGFPRVSAIIRGMKCHVPGSSTYGDRSTYPYTDNPAYLLADFLDSRLYGAGVDLDWGSVATVAADCAAEVVSGHPRRTVVGIVLDSAQDTASQIETLRTYAGCMVVTSGAVTRLVSDKAGDVNPLGVFGADDIVDGPIKIKKRGLANVPTVVRVIYTDTTTIPWQESAAVAMRPGVSTGETPYRESTVRLPGIQRYAHALREAIERLNAAHLTDLSLRVTVFDHGIAVQAGDIVEITHPIGLTAKRCRVLAVTESQPWRWDMELYEYDPLVYSNSIETAPSTADTTLPDPRNLPAVTGLTLTEEVFQRANGTYASRVRCRWDDAGLAPAAGYRVDLRLGGDQLLWSATTQATDITTIEVQEAVQYEVAVAAEMYGFKGAAAAANITAAGKYLVPGDVSSLVGFEVGGEVRLSWEPAADIDIWRYEIRYGATTGSWDAASLLDRVDGLRTVIKEIPEGTWRFYVKAVDSVRQYSATAAWSDIAVTKDFRAFMVDNPQAASPTLTHVASYQDNRYDGVTHYINDTADTWASLFASAMSSYTNPIAAYFDDYAATWESEALDFGAEYTGNFIFADTAEALAGSTVTVTYSTAPDNGGVPGTWENNTAASFKATARFAKIKIAVAAGHTFHAQIPGIGVRLNVVTNEESGSDTSSASAAKTITLTAGYALAKSVIVTPHGTTAAIGVVDNITLGEPSSFDVYVFDAAGAQIARDFTWRFQGI